MRVRRLGLTGGIGSGKSTVAQMLVGCGAHLVDTDAIARQLSQAGGAAMPALEAAFGPRAVTAGGALDREHMRRVVFSDAAAKARLEAILHPLIAVQAQVQAGAALGRPVVFDVPLLSESSLWRERVERVLVIDCTLDTQLERVAHRPGWDEASARQMVQQQASRAARRAIADAVIFNDGVDLDALQAEVHELWQAWCAMR